MADCNPNTWVRNSGLLRTNLGWAVYRCEVEIVKKLLQSDEKPWLFGSENRPPFPDFVLSLPEGSTNRKAVERGSELSPLEISPCPPCYLEATAANKVEITELLVEKHMWHLLQDIGDKEEDDVERKVMSDKTALLAGKALGVWMGRTPSSDSDGRQGALILRRLLLKDSEVGEKQVFEPGIKAFLGAPSSLRRFVTAFETASGENVPDVFCALEAVAPDVREELRGLIHAAAQNSLSELAFSERLDSFLTPARREGCLKTAAELTFAGQSWDEELQKKVQEAIRSGKVSRLEEILQLRANTQPGDLSTNFFFEPKNSLFHRVARWWTASEEEENAVGHESESEEEQPKKMKPLSHIEKNSLVRLEMTQKLLEHGQKFCEDQKSFKTLLKTTTDEDNFSVFGRAARTGQSEIVLTLLKAVEDNDDGKKRSCEEAVKETIELLCGALKPSLGFWKDDIDRHGGDPDFEE